MTEAIRPKVSVVKVSPDTVLDGIAHAMKLADYQKYLSVNIPTLLKINTSWQHYYPACSTSPWQLDGVIQTLKNDGHKDLIPLHNGTVVVDSREGEVNNKHSVVQKKHNLTGVHLEEENWVRFNLNEELLVLDKVYEDGIYIPQIMEGKNIIHLPTMKTHVFTTVTGAMKNAFGGLLNFERHWTHSVIHETLVDLLRIQKQIHPAIFAVSDGTFVGSGPGPRAMKWHQKNMIIAGADQVAVDAVVATMMGFNPMQIDFIRISHEVGLGCADIDKIDIIGEEISEIDCGFERGKNTLASIGQKMIYWGPLKPLENVLLRSRISPWAYVASNLYHNQYWLRFIGRRRISEAMSTPWGRLFQEY